MSYDKRLVSAVVSVLFSIAGASATGADEKPPLAESFLISGKLADGETALTAALKANPRDDQARFGLGVVQFACSVERRSQAFYRHGYRSDVARGMLPVTNLPIPPNPKPEPFDAAKARALLQAWVDELKTVDATLAGINDTGVKLPIHFGLIKLDLNGDGQLAEDETLWKVYSRFNSGANVTPENSRDFVIAFDRGDVDWLRGYCHLLMALSESILAYDFSHVFDEYGFLIFSGMTPKHAYQGIHEARGEQLGMIFDAIGLIHEFRLPVADPGRLKSALAHLESTSALSRSSWKAIRAETDDDREWIPNSSQHTVVPKGRVSPEMIEAWFTFLGEFESILAGKKLLPFWRGNDPTLGLNLRKVFTEPKPLDLVRWVQGPGVDPFLEHGEMTSKEVWGRINQIFNGNFVGFAIWFN